MTSSALRFTTSRGPAAATAAAARAATRRTAGRTLLRGLRGLVQEVQGVVGVTCGTLIVTEEARAVRQVGVPHEAVEIEGGAAGTLDVFEQERARVDGV